MKARKKRDGARELSRVHREVARDRTRDQEIKRLLITGSAGFIGSHAVKAARDRGWEVTEHDSKDSNSLWFFPTSGAELIAILHLGAFSSNAGFADNLAANYTNNCQGFAHIAEVSRQCGARLLYASSSAVYGNNSFDRGDADNENDILDQCKIHSHYAKSKLINEMMAESYRTIGLNALGLRIFNAYGSGDELKPVGRQAPMTWMQAAKREGKPAVIYGDGTQAKDFIHVSDVVEIIMRLLESDAQGVVNVGTGVATSFNDLARMIFDPPQEVKDRVAEVHLRYPTPPGIPLPEHLRLREWQQCVDYRPIPDPASYQFYTRADTSRLLSIIGPYKFKTIEEGLTL